MATVTRTGGRQSAADASTYSGTIGGGTALAIGADGADHTLVFPCFAIGGGLSDITSLTIETDKVATAVAAAVTDGVNTIRFFLLARSALTDPTAIEVDWSFATNAPGVRAAIEACVAVGISTTPTGTASNATAATSQSVDVDVIAGGIIIGATASLSGTVTLAWTGLTAETQITSWGGEAASLLIGLLSDAASTESPRTVTATGHQAGQSPVSIAASFPAAAGAAAARVTGIGLTESRLLRRTQLIKASHTMTGWTAKRGLWVPERRLAA